MICSVCGAQLPDGAHFCANCGAPVAAPLGTEERKVVTVLFADLVDSTGLAQRLDPERAREVLGRFFDVASEELRALRGHPEKFIGDAVMAVFGLPTVHEDDALRAVRAGLAIRGRVRQLGDALGLAEPLAVRVGIESGEAATGLGPIGQLLVTGLVVNAAARLQAAAGLGEVLVGETTVALTEAAVMYGDRREVQAKGFDALAGSPVEELSSRSRRRTIPFVGRASELAILRESLTRASSTGQPVFATIVGEAGIGKSRLADELVAGLGDDVTVVSGRARSFTDTATFAPVAAIVGDLAGVDEDDDPEVARRRLGELVERSPRGHDERIVERLSLLFGTARRRDEPAFVDAIHAGFVALLDRVASDRSFVLVFEDAHTLRPAMLDLIERLGAPPRDGPRRAMILSLARSDLLNMRQTWGSNAVNAVTLHLDPLPPAESIDLVRQAAGGRIDDADAAQIATRAGGNPFFIIETTGMLLPSTGGGGPSSRTALPPTVQAVVSARLDALPPRLRDLARRTSAFFVSFDLEELLVVDPDASLDEVRQLEEAEILVREEGSRTVARWRVRHATVKDVAYSSLPKRERRRLHQLIADLLDATGHPSWAAEHLELAARASLDVDPENRSVPERAADALLGAGDRARRRMENRSAIDYYERALELGGPEPGWGVREARALAGIGEADYWLGEYAVATERLERAVTLATRTDDPFALALALRFLGDIAINVEADLEKAENLLHRSLAAAEELGDPWAIVRTLLFAGWVPWTRKRHEEAEAIWDRALANADPEDGWARVRAMNSLSINRDSMGDHREALRLSDEAIALAERIGDRFSVAITNVQRGRVLEDLGRFEQALPCIERGLAIFEELGARWELADATAERGDVVRELGRLEQSEEDLRRALLMFEDLGERQLIPWMWRSLGKVAERRGDRAEAEERMRRSREAEEQLQRPQPSRAVARSVARPG